MGKILVLLKVIPRSPETDTKKLKETIAGAISSLCRINNVETEPLAFGLSSLKITVVAEEDAATLNKIEEAIDNVEEVSSVEIINISRAL